MTAVNCFVWNQGGEFLLLLRGRLGEHDRWLLPCGETKKNEPITDALRRILKEQIGVTETPVSYLGSVHVRGAFVGFQEHHFFAMVLREKPVNLRPDGECHDSKFVTLEQCRGLFLVDDLPGCLEKFGKRPS